MNFLHASICLTLLLVSISIVACVNHSGIDALGVRRFLYEHCPNRLAATVAVSCVNINMSQSYLSICQGFFSTHPSALKSTLSNVFVFFLIIILKYSGKNTVKKCCKDVPNTFVFSKTGVFFKVAPLYRERERCFTFSSHN